MVLFDFYFYIKANKNNAKKITKIGITKTKKNVRLMERYGQSKTPNHTNL